MQIETCFIAGISGSIGDSTLSVMKHLHVATRLENTSYKRSYVVVGCSLYRRTAKLIAFLKQMQAEKMTALFPLRVVAVSDQAARLELAKFLHQQKEWQHVRLCADTEEAFALSEADVLINALSGGAGLLPTVRALYAKKRILLANKESLVMGGALIRHWLAKEGLSLDECILPIDSEHKALQTLSRGLHPHEIDTLTITASGGPFLEKPNDNPRPEEALKHPNWDMGAKISIDSATMMNKGLEIIEAHVLFDLPYDKLRAVIHKEQVIHGIIELVNGEMMALLGASDMCYSIQGALTYPDLLPRGAVYKPFRLTAGPPLTFQEIPAGRYPLFELACDCGRRAGPFPVILNAINEVAIEAFLAKQMSFQTMVRTVLETITHYDREGIATSFDACNLEAIITLDRDVRDFFQRTQLKGAVSSG